MKSDESSKFRLVKSVIPYGIHKNMKCSLFATMLKKISRVKFYLLRSKDYFFNQR